MDNKRRFLLTHYDLDGVAADILMSNMYMFEKKHMCGYAKIKEKIDNGELSGYDSGVITDVSLAPEQFSFISKEYKDKLLYIDHHKPSINAVSNNEYKSTCVVDTTFSASGLIFQTFFKKLKKVPHVVDFVIAVDAYDMWRIDTNIDNFKKGYDLNVLFWKYGYFDFYDRFFDNMSFNFSSTEKKYISDHKKERDDHIIHSDKTDFGNNSLLVLDAPADYVNDFTIQLPDYDIYFMVCTTREGTLTLSMRSKLNGVESDLGNVAKNAKNMFDYIISAGGHPKAAGIDFFENTSIDDILTVVEYVNDTMEANELIPF